MESSSYDPFEDSIDSSSAVPTPADSPLPPQNVQDSTEPARIEMETTTVISHDDSTSDISMSADSDDEEDQEPDSSTGQTIARQQDLEESTILDTNDQGLEPSKKRKFAESTGSHSPAKDEDTHEDRKRPKPFGSVCRYRTASDILNQDKSLLPAEIWHHIFTFCAPKTLGLLLQVNRSFNAYLGPSSVGASIDPLSKSVLQILTPDAIWRASRRLYCHPSMPLPLQSKSELDMWKIACGSSCQFCGKKNDSDPIIPSDQWHPGPGEKGVIPVWSFGIRSCGPCLQVQSIKEIDLLLSSSIPSTLMVALPFIFLTNELHALSAATLQSGQHPSSIQITKLFSKSHVHEIKEEFESVKAMGSATTEEWLKGLDGRGREKISDAARWERWDAAGGVAKMHSFGSARYLQNSTQMTSAKPGTTLPSTGQLPVGNRDTSSAQSPPPLQVSASFPKKPLFALPQIPPLQMFIHNSLEATSTSPRFDSPLQNGLPPHPPPPRPFQQAKHERTKEQVAELKAARRVEIERRCMLLTPPITPAVLAQMPSFQAAIQIIQPLDDNAWEVLKPRLLYQRVEAEQRENDRLAQTRVVQERFDSLRYQDMQAGSDSKDLVDQEWDDFQAPLRARIGGYADEIIRDGWANGEKVSYDTAPLFAAEVLIYVRKRFYAEVAKDEAAILATGREPEKDPPEGPYTRKLILENMKWVFDTKIKPHSEPHRKELFLCNACEYAAKYYGFEGVIQHFAAKHTSALSFGSIVVHWKSEWPETPPFNPEPNSVEHYYGTEPNASVPYQTSGPPAQQTFGYGGYQPNPVSISMQGPSPHGYQEPHAPYYGSTQYGDQYLSHQNGPFVPTPQTYPDASQGYQAPQYTVAQPPANISGYNDMPQDYSPQGYGGQYQPQAQTAFSQSHSGPSYPATGPDYSLQQPRYAQPTTQYGSVYPLQASYPPNNYPVAQAPQKTEEYTAQIQHIARNAREVWNLIGNLKEVPGSLKVHTVIYHILNKYRTAFQDDPPLAMIVDGLSNNKDMRPVRNVNGLLCKACSLGMAGAISSLQKKHFSFPQLVNHFHSVHEQGLPPDLLGHVPDWTRDMVDLPDMSKLTSVVNAPGMDDRKFKLFTEALPELVAPPQQDVIESDITPSQQYGPYPNQYDYNQLAPSKDNHEKYYTAVENGRASEADSVTYDSGEYDPRNPHDIPMDHGPSYKLPRRDQSPRGSGNIGPNQSVYQYESRQAAPPIPYQDRTEIGYLDQRSTSQPSHHARPVADYDHVIVRDEPVYVERPIRYREPAVEYRTRRDAPNLAYENSRPSSSSREYRRANSQSYNTNRDIPTNAYEVPTRESGLYPAEGATDEHNRISEVVAQISQQANQVRERIPVKPDPVDAGSEDGEVRVESSSRPEPPRLQVQEDASSAAERFLNDFIPGETTEAAAKRKEAELRKEKSQKVQAAMEFKPIRGNAYPQSQEPQQPTRSGYEEDGRYYSSTSGRPLHPMEDELGSSGYVVHERVPASRPVRTVVYEDSYPDPVAEPGGQRGRSPELVDRRFKLNNVIYREERQSSQSTHRTPSRYARYESVRLENDRVRSGSPAYVKVGPQPGQYPERSPGAPIVHQEPLYRTRTPPPAADEAPFERQPRQEYYRVYAEEPPPREPQYELVRVSDPRGDYMIRRLIREPEPVYASYNDERYTRQPVYESRPPPSRSGPVTYEEYDPHHPEPAPAPAPTRPIAYQ